MGDMVVGRVTHVQVWTPAAGNLCAISIPMDDLSHDANRCGASMIAIS
ncbi:hypothetical protein FBZ84_1367 [Azospirillum baldaniorum]|nr:hypothetical protein FBZ84_1367 [Azospirillum baldaniorum]